MKRSSLMGLPWLFPQAAMQQRASGMIKIIHLVATEQCQAAPRNDEPVSDWWLLVLCRVSSWQGRPPQKAALGGGA